MKDKKSICPQHISRKAIGIMTEAKTLLRDRGITVNVTTLDTSERLLKLMSIFDDQEVIDLRDRLLAAIELYVNQGQQESDRTRLISPQMAKWVCQDDTPDFVGKELKSQRRHVLPSESRSQGGDESLPKSDFICPKPHLGPSDSIKKWVYPSASSLGFLQCERCSCIMSVRVEGKRSHRPLDVQYTCEQTYLVMPKERRFPRRTVQPKGVYITDGGATTGKINIDNFSFQGVQFYTEEEHGLQPGERVDIQFALDDPWTPFVWEQAKVEHVYGNSLFVKFDHTDEALMIADTNFNG